jgi:hypothetical protein
MRILIAGATGAIGRPLIRCLDDDHHGVFALARSPELSRMVTQLGAEPVPASRAQSARQHPCGSPNRKPSRRLALTRSITRPDCEALPTKKQNASSNFGPPARVARPKSARFLTLPPGGDALCQDHLVDLWRRRISSIRKPSRRTSVIPACRTVGKAEHLEKPDLCRWRQKRGAPPRRSARSSPSACRSQAKRRPTRHCLR